MIPPIAIEVKPLRLGATLRFWGQVWGQTRVIRRSFAYFSVPALEDMFGRRQKPTLEIVLEEGAKQDGTEDLIVLLLNQGRAVARHAGFLMYFQNAEIVTAGGQMQNNTHINAGRPVVGFDNNTGVIHPNGIRINLGMIRLRRKDPTQSIEGNVTLYCEGARNVIRAPLPSRRHFRRQLKRRPNATSDFSVAIFVRRRISSPQILRNNHPSTSCAHGPSPNAWWLHDPSNWRHHGA
ncbi:hypothetical protein [Bradyrhizobium sp.]|uniref:hypothetical protein n=1 Tax=Bradyrhizobium sp. TaxID=376 RepID=UPI003BB0A30D